MEEEIRRKAEKEEERDRQRENKGFFVFARISYENVKRLREQIGNLGSAKSLQCSAERMGELWDRQKT